MVCLNNTLTLGGNRAKHRSKNIPDGLYQKIEKLLDFITAESAQLEEANNDSRA